MPISPELQAKIDALEDEKLRARILGVLTGPGIRRASDEEIYESIVSDYAAAEAYWGKLKKWRDEEVADFAQYLKGRCPGDYLEFQRQEKEYQEIEDGLAWIVFRVIREWRPGLDESDVIGLFGKFRGYVRLHLI
ncbi:hypothetical protein [Pseudomonas sp. CGJS7]|uniref:hypothetical protein n=1 Tax=Pseudomonas sp. CGJS7 TaxID=3109348 RepID=UPI00300A1C5E